MGKECDAGKKRRQFIHALAIYLGGPNQANMSIRLQMGHADAKQWSELRGLTPLFGYPTVEEAEAVLTRFLDTGPDVPKAYAQLMQRRVDRKAK
jgi:hypothetical protein